MPTFSQINMNSNYMDDFNDNYYINLEKGRKLEKKALKKLDSLGFFCNKEKDAAELYEKAAHFYCLAQSWDNAGAAYLKSAGYHLKLDSKHEAANAYTEAGHAYKNTSTEEAASCLEQSANIFLEAGNPSVAAGIFKEIAEIYENDQDFGLAIHWYEKAVDHFRSDDVSTSVNLCMQKIAELAAQLQQYTKAIDIYEDIARQFLGSTSLMSEVKGIWLNSGICHLCKGDSVSITNALDKYQAMDPEFIDTPERKFLSDLASAVDEKDVSKFTAKIREFDRAASLGPWKTLLLLKVKAKMINPDFDTDPLL